VKLPVTDAARHIYITEDGYRFEDIGDMEDLGDEDLKVNEASSSRMNKDKWFKPTDIVAPRYISLCLK
jgi:hypothetical protein